ncbi:MAG TPA: MFS transporter [Mycobacteriales bacterium]|nr:MFS transporter [Mycobacteriales bacterium]
MNRLRSVGGGAPLFPLFVLLGLSVLDEVDESAFNVLSPDIRDAFHLSNTQFVAMRTGIVPLLLVAGLVFGYFTDRRRRSRLASYSALVIGGCALALGLAPAVLGVMIGLRILAGTGRQMNRPSHQSLLADYYAPATRAGVFSVWRMALPLGLLVGPLLAGGVAAVSSWRVAIAVLAVPSIALLLVSRRLVEPPRGVQDRLAAGADESTAATSEDAPSWEEAWRTLNGVQSMRRIWRSLPFLVGGILGLGVLLPLYYQDEFLASDAVRGVITASGGPALFVGLVVGIPLTRRLLLTRPSQVLRLFALAASVGAAGLVVVAVAPSVWVAAVGADFGQLCFAMLLPGFGALTSLIIPPRARGLSFSVIEIWALPGLVFVILATRIGDAYGFRWSIVAMTAVFLVGGYIVASAGGKVRGDITKMQTAARAQAEARLARERGEAKLLITRGLDVCYGQVQVLFGVDFDVADGEIVALLGTNGAGKSTLLKAICGLVEPSAGAIVWDGRDTTHTTPQLALQRGVVLMPGGRGVFPSLTVAENLEAAAWQARREGSDVVADRRRDALDRFPRLRERLDQPAGNLSGGEQQMLALSMAFLARPRLLCIDELSLGLAPAIVEQLLDIVRAIHAGGTTVVLVEQSVNVALSVAQRAIFMEKGEVRFEGATRDLLGRDDILRSVFLSAATANLAAPGQVRQRGHDLGAFEPTVVVTDVTRSYGGIRAVDGVSLHVDPGEIVGLIGANGAGKTTLFDLVSGNVAVDSGRIQLAGRDVTRSRPDQRALAGLGRSFQDAALFPSLTVRETIALAHDRKLQCRDAISAALALPDQRVEEHLLRARVDELIDLVGIGAFADKFVSELSTGSRRIVDLACSIAHDPVVLLLDEPSSGIAQREAEALGPLLLSIRDATGMAMIVIEHDMPLIAAVSDRMYAMEVGRVIAEGPPASVMTDPRVVSSYLGSDTAAIERSGPGRDLATVGTAPPTYEFGALDG